MNLEDWLRRDHSLAEQLKVVEGLCDAVHEDHQHGVVHRALEPANVEVASDGSCDLQGAVRPDAATPAAPRYRAPEVLEGAPYGPRADIYSVGVICYEILSGQNPSGSDRPQPLPELRADVARDLTDAIMGCLERGPDWRPRDLSYMLQVVSSRGGAGKPAARPAKAVAADTPRPAVSAAPRRMGARGKSSGSHAPLFVVFLVILLAAAAGAWFWRQSQGQATPASQAAAPARPLPPTPSPETTALATPTPIATATGTPKATAPVEKPPSPEAAPGDQTRPRVQPTPAPAPRPGEGEGAPATRLSEAAPPPTPAPRPQEPSASEPAVLTALSPLSLKRPTSAAILDLRGIGLRPDHQAHFMKIKTPPAGISIVKQKYVGPNLLQVVVRLDEAAAPGTYALGVEDARGEWSNTLVFTVTK